MIKYFLIIVLFLNSFATFSQSSEIFQGEKVNVRDAENKRQGVWVTQNANGNLEEKGTYTDNKKEGIWLGYYPSGKLKHEITYLNNRPDGPAKFYYEDGKISEQGIWKINKWVGEYKYYHENGSLAYDWSYNESGRRTGEQKYYYDDGSLMIQGDWTDGKKIGTLTEYYQDGSVKSEMDFVEGKVQVASIKEFQVAEKPALRKTAPTLQKVEPSKNKGNNPGMFTQTGYYKTYNEFKKLDREGDFVNGKLVTGKRFFYNDNGDLTRTLIYKDSKVVETIDANP
jgi:antitoxin component YwqK of YwqJK toxin-antitoxin module